MFEGRRVAVVIPAYRAAATIEGVIEAVPQWVDHLIVVNDASPDALADVLARIADARLTVMTHPKNLGVGGAVVTGYKVALERGCDIVVKLDADGQMDPRFIPDLLTPIVAEGFDFAKGNRFVFRDALRKMPRARLLGNIGLSVFVKMASGLWNSMDPTNGFFAITADTLKRINVEALAQDYFLECSQLIELGIIGARIADVPMSAVYAGEPSSLSVGRALRTFLPRLARGTVYRLWVKYGLLRVHPILLLTPIGLLATLGGAVFGGYHWAKSVHTGHIASAGTVRIAVAAVLVGLFCLAIALVLDVLDAPAPYSKGAMVPCRWTERWHGSDPGETH